MAKARATGAVSVATAAEKRGAGATTKESHEVIETPPITGPVAQATVKVGHTLGLPNYSSLRVDVEVTLPCSSSDMEDTLVKASHIALRHARRIEADWLDGPAEPDDDFAL